MRWWSIVAVADGATVGVTSCGVPNAWRMLAAGRVSSVDHAAATACVAVVELAALWLAVGLAAQLASALPGVVGAGARRVAVWALPRIIQRLLAGAVGVGVVAAPAAAGALGPVPADPPRAAAGYLEPAAAGSLEPEPTATAAPRTSSQSQSTSLPAPGWPTDDPLPAPRWPASDPWQPSGSAPSPTAGPATSLPALRHRQVRVRPGDSLWTLAAGALPGRPTPARIAAEWPRWWAANRSVIGADPNLLHPGEVLTVPAPVGKEASK